jgi:Domain of unknown function (DUF4852)
MKTFILLIGVSILLIADPNWVVGQKQSSAKTVEGTVVAEEWTPPWLGYRIQSGSKQYKVITFYNTKEPPSPPAIGGCCKVGLRIRVLYDRVAPGNWLVPLRIMALGWNFPASMDTTTGSVPPPLDPELALYYLAANYGLTYFYGPQHQRARVSIPTLYGQKFDRTTYDCVTTNEFDGTKCWETLVAQVNNGAKAVDFNRKFTSISWATLDQYNFVTGSFPITRVEGKGLWDFLSVSFSDPPGVKKDSFWSVPMSEVAGREFMRRRSLDKSIDPRKVLIKFTYRITNAKGTPPWGIIGSPTLPALICSIEAFEDDDLTKKLGGSSDYCS